MATDEVTLALLGQKLDQLSASVNQVLRMVERHDGTLYGTDDRAGVVSRVTALEKAGAEIAPILAQVPALAWQVRVLIGIVVFVSITVGGWFLAQLLGLIKA